jgi:outer membrane lipoprotein-sorting protein
MKQVITMFTLLLITTIANAQDAKAEQMVNDIANQIENYDNIYVEFKHKIDNKEADIHRETKGNVTLKKDLYHFNYMGSEQFYDGIKVYSIIHEDEEVIIKNGTENEEDSLSPSEMFTFYKKGFTYKMDVLKNTNGKKIQYIKLTPIDTNSETNYILMGVDTSTKNIYNIIQVDKNTTEVTLQVTKFISNQTISNQLFSFDRAKYEDKDYDITETK